MIFMLLTKEVLRTLFALKPDKYHIQAGFSVKITFLYYLLVPNIEK